jgi:hypothetical protein
VSLTQLVEGGSRRVLGDRFRDVPELNQRGSLPVTLDQNAANASSRTVLRLDLVGT